MKLILFIFIFCLINILFIRSLHGQNLTIQQKTNIEKQVDSVFLSMVKTAENIDYDKISLGVDDKYNAGFIVNNSYFANYDSMIIILKNRLRAGTKQQIVLKYKKITVLSEFNVLLTATGDAHVEIQTGQSFTVRFFWSFVYQRFGKEWKVIQSHQSQTN